ncbi:MAG: Putative Metallo-beta-lactamase family protein [Nitrospira sp.]|nr:MAG: Putative Metallo-beta-lactamase family protein [Nitrospira sp.]
MIFSKWWSIPGALAVLLFLVCSTDAQQPRPIDEITNLAENVYLFRHQSHQAIFIVTPAGVIVTDPISPDATAWLKIKIAALTDQPVRYVIYSHHHNDHISGGSVFSETAHFVSQQAARPKILQAADPDIPVPDLTFTDRMTIELGGKQVELIYTGKNHSDNSLVVLLPQNRLLFAVDFIPVETVAYRALPDAYPDDWIESLKQVEQLDFDTLVPGHGKVGTKEHVRLFREYLEALRLAVSEQIRHGATLEEAQHQVRLPKYEPWQSYADWFPENVAGMYRYLSQQAKK